jgi:uncharacterized repeat protein (TIGR04002 family)
MKTTKLLVLSSLFAAIIFIFTAYILHIPIGATLGYIHFGDAFIFIAACILPFPYALLSAAIGASLADILTGVPIWAPATIIIKSLMALMFTNKSEKILKSNRNIIAPILAGLICLVGYYLYEAVFIDNFRASLASIPLGLVQLFGSAIFFYVISALFDKLNIVKYIHKYL